MKGRSLIAFEHDGSFKWRSPAFITLQSGPYNYGAPALADLDGDGTPEIVHGATVLNADGTIRWNREGTTGTGIGSNDFGPLSVVADLDMDGIPEVIAGKTAYRADGTLYWNASISDSFNAIGNFDNDTYPEIVAVTQGRFTYLNMMAP
jgi:hypothetical protein